MHLANLDGIHYSAKPKPVINDKTKEKGINHFTKIDTNHKYECQDEKWFYTTSGRRNLL